MSTYTAGNISVPVVPTMEGFFKDIDRRVQGWTPPPVTVRPEVDTKPAEDGLRKESSGGGGLAAAGAVAGLAIGAALVASLTKALDFSSANGKLQAQLGLSAQDAGRYGKIAGDLYAGAYGDSIGGVNDALKAVAQSGAVAANATDQQIQGVTGSVLHLSTAFGVDATDSANALGQMMRTGLAPNAEAALDIITRGLQAGDDKAGDFLDTINEYSTQFRKLGLNGADATGLISQGLKAGARDSDLVADSIKEFSIRAVDGSKTTAAGFAAIGLNAGSMAERIGAGGDVAKVALAQTLDGIRSIKDPTAQAQAATALFGTQAEDLGAALLALHPETAAAGLGKVEGATADLGAALDTPASKLQAFWQSLQVGVVDLIGGKILPIFSTLVDWGQKIFNWGPVPDILSFLFTSGGVLVGVFLGIAGAIKVWTVAQTGLNVALEFAAKNPIVLIIAAIAALVAGLIWAYNNVEWFRDFVDAAFRVVGDVATWLWTNAIKPAFDAIAGAAVWLWQTILVPAFDAIMAAFRFVGDVASWLWENVLSPVFSFIATAAQVLFAIIFTVLVTPLILAWKLVAAVATWLWETVLAPVFDAIGAAATWLWENALKPVWDALVWVWQNVIGPVATWLWQSVFVPIFNGIGAAVSWVWDNVLKPVFDALVWFWQNVLAPVLNWLYVNIFQPIWDGIGAAISLVWNSVIKPVFDAMVTGVNWVKDGFSAAVDWIGRIWDGMKRLLAVPVNFLIETVWNKGILVAWNWVADLLPGVDPAKELDKIPGYAKGGPIPEEMLIRAGEAGPEYMLSAPAVANLGGLDAADRLHRNLIRGKDNDETGGTLADYGASLGQTWQKLWGIVHGAFPTARLTSAYRPGANDYHGRGMAVDVAGPTSMDMPFMLAVDRWIANNYPGSTELIHTPGVNLKNGQPHTYSPTIQAQHYNHVHWAMAPGGSFGAEGGGSTSGHISNWFQTKVRELVSSASDAVIGAIPFHGPPRLLDVPKNIATFGRDKVLDFLVGEGKKEDDKASVVYTGGAGVEQWRGLVQGALARLGLSPADTDRTLRRMNQESGGNPRAINNWDSNAMRGTPSKGLMQVIDPTFRAYRDPGLSPDIWDPMANVVASMRYAKGHYGSLAAAYDRPGGYDSGGFLPPGLSTVFNGTGRPEPVLTSEQWDLVRPGGGDGAQILLQAREPMSSSEISRLADEVVRKQDWSRRRTG